MDTCVIRLRVQIEATNGGKRSHVLQTSNVVQNCSKSVHCLIDNAEYSMKYNHSTVT